MVVGRLVPCTIYLTVSLLIILRNTVERVLVPRYTSGTYYFSLSRLSRK